VARACCGAAYLLCGLQGCIYAVGATGRPSGPALRTLTMLARLGSFMRPLTPSTSSSRRSISLRCRRRSPDAAQPPDAGQRAPGGGDGCRSSAGHPDVDARSASPAGMDDTEPRRATAAPPSPLPPLLATTLGSAASAAAFFAALVGGRRRRFRVGTPFAAAAAAARASASSPPGAVEGRSSSRAAVSGPPLRGSRGRWARNGPAAPAHLSALVNTPPVSSTHFARVAPARAARAPGSGQVAPRGRFCAGRLGICRPARTQEDYSAATGSSTDPPALLAQ
jgi:hypothetical protein